MKFNTCNINNDKLDTYIQLGLNVLLIGEKGTGKSQRILDAFERNNLKYVYFSGSTIDPFLHLIGVPQIEGESLKFILPSNINEDMEAIFIDELNRSPKLVRNALMELIQFKSINGRKFPRLKSIFAAINPLQEGDYNYDVENLDPAQMDRFHIIIELPNIPDKKYFTSKFGSHKGGVLIDWWNSQNLEAKQIISSRRLDYVGELFEKGIDIKDILPVNCNVKSLIKNLHSDEDQLLFDKTFSSSDLISIKKFMSDDRLFLKFEKKLINEKYFQYFEFVNIEFLYNLFKTNLKFRDFVIYSTLKNHNVYSEMIRELISLNDNAGIILDKVMKILESKKSIIDFEELNEGLVDFKNLASTGNPLFINQYANHIINMNVHKNLQFDGSVGYFTTAQKRYFYKVFIQCWKTLPFAFSGFLLSCYKSMQKGTLKNLEKFDGYFVAGIYQLINHPEYTPAHKKQILNSMKSFNEKTKSHALIISMIENGTMIGDISTSINEAFELAVKL